MKRADVHAFGLRVAMALPASEANTFLGDAAASRLPRNRSLFRDDTWGGDSEKFKPYMLPSLEELTAIRDALKKRTRSGPAPVTTSVNE